MINCKKDIASKEHLVKKKVAAITTSTSCAVESVFRTDGFTRNFSG